MGLWSTLGTVIGGAAGTLLGNPLLGASLGGALGGAGDQANAEAEQKKRQAEMQRQKELQQRQSMAAGYAMTTLPQQTNAATSPQQSNNSGGIWDTIGSMANQIAANIGGNTNNNSTQSTSSAPAASVNTDKAVNAAFEKLSSNPNPGQPTPSNSLWGSMVANTPQYMDSQMQSNGLGNNRYNIPPSPQPGLFSGGFGLNGRYRYGY